MSEAKPQSVGPILRPAWHGHLLPKWAKPSARYLIRRRSLVSQVRTLRLRSFGTGPMLANTNRRSQYALQGLNDVLAVKASIRSHQLTGLAAVTSQQASWKASVNDVISLFREPCPAARVLLHNAASLEGLVSEGCRFRSHVVISQASRNEAGGLTVAPHREKRGAGRLPRN